MLAEPKFRTPIALASIALLVGVSAAPANAESTESVNFSITVTAEPDPCDGVPVDAVTWAPDTDIYMEDINTLQSGLSSIDAYPGASIQMSLGLNFVNGTYCDLGFTYDLFPDGEVTASWTIPGIDLDIVSCDGVQNICDASSTSSVIATALVPVNAADGIYSGTLDVTWIPAG